MTKSRKSTKPALRRYDGSGHINPEYAEQLMALSGQATAETDPKSFVEDPSAEDDLAEELGEEAVVAMTSGQDPIAEERDAPVDEEVGGPFVETAASTEFAGGTDESNIADATREPFPTT
jgi:hypothetical protein